MRYPVADEFTMALTGRLYELLVEKGSRCRLRSG